MNRLKANQTAKHTFPPIRVDLMDRLLDKADEISGDKKKPLLSRWKRR